MYRSLPGKAWMKFQIPRYPGIEAEKKAIVCCPRLNHTFEAGMPTTFNA